MPCHSEWRFCRNINWDKLAVFSVLSILPSVRRMHKESNSSSSLPSLHTSFSAPSFTAPSFLKSFYQNSGRLSPQYENEIRWDQCPLFAKQNVLQWYTDNVTKEWLINFGVTFMHPYVMLVLICFYCIAFNSN